MTTLYSSHFKNKSPLEKIDSRQFPIPLISSYQPYSKGKLIGLRNMVYNTWRVSGGFQATHDFSGVHSKFRVFANLAVVSFQETKPDLS